MTFQLVYLSQQDPQWKNDLLGFGDPGDTIGMYGCALTSVAMLVSGHGYAETPKTLNEKLKANQGFVSSGIRWDVVNKVHPQITLRENIMCENVDAPIAKINAALDAGQPVVVRVDSSPAPGLQWHYVMVYARQGQGNDYLMLDPYPYSPGTTKPDLLMARYSRGNPLERSIQQVLIYQCSTSGGTISLPSTPSTTTTTPQTQPATASSLGTGPRARVMDAVTWGLNVRSSTDTSSLANLVANVPAGSELALLEPNAEAKIGVNGQWVKVRTAEGKEGYAAAWFLEKVSAGSTTSSTGSTSSSSDASGTSSNSTPIGRSRPSVAAGLENVALEAPANQRINDTGLLARIWNKYGGLLAAIAQKMGFDPAIAVAIMAQESGGYAFGPDGRMIIRFENHLFYQYWGSSNAATYNKFFQTGNPIWTGHKWRAKVDAPWQDFHGNQSLEWQVFTFACNLNDTAAKKSISMGSPQILGSNFSLLGFASVQDMFNAFTASERNQVIAFFDFLQGNGANALNALKASDFRTIASIYNGAGQADYYGNLIKGHYNNFVALRGTQSSTNSTTSSTTDSTSTSTTTTDSSSTSTTTTDSSSTTTTDSTSTSTTPNKPSDPPKVQVVVKANATNVYANAIGTQVISVEKANARLTIVESPDTAKTKIGVKGQRINVKASNNKRGFIDGDKVRST